MFWPAVKPKGKHLYRVTNNTWGVLYFTVQTKSNSSQILQQHCKPLTDLQRDWFCPPADRYREAEPVQSLKPLSRRVVSDACWFHTERWSLVLKLYSLFYNSDTSFFVFLGVCGFLFFSHSLCVSIQPNRPTCGAHWQPDTKITSHADAHLGFTAPSAAAAAAARPHSSYWKLTLIDRFSAALPRRSHFLLRAAA